MIISVWQVHGLTTIIAVTIVTMEWEDYHTRIAIIGLFKSGKSAAQIFALLRPLKMSERFVYRTIKRYSDTGDVVDRFRSGRPRSVRTKKAIEAVRSRINRNPLRKQKIVAREMKINARSVSRIIRDDLGMHAYKRSTSHLLTDRLKRIRLERSKKLLRSYGRKKFKQILFTDEKIFTVEEKYNKQNDRVYARSSLEAREKVSRVQRGHHPAQVMVWWGVSWHGVTQIHFCEKGVKTGARVYQNSVLNPLVKPLSDTLFEGIDWVFQQDSAPGHKAKTTQEWLENNVPNFIKASDWPSASPDLNPLDYGLWNILEERACKKRHANLESLKRSIVKAAAEIPLETIRTCIEQWPERLRRCIEKEGGHFE